MPRARLLFPVLPLALPACSVAVPQADCTHGQQHLPTGALHHQGQDWTDKAKEKKDWDRCTANDCTQSYKSRVWKQAVNELWKILIFCSTPTLRLIEVSLPSSNVSLSHPRGNGSAAWGKACRSLLIHFLIKSHRQCFGFAVFQTWSNNCATYISRHLLKIKWHGSLF